MHDDFLKYRCNYSKLYLNINCKHPESIWDMWLVNKFHFIYKLTGKYKLQFELIPRVMVKYDINNNIETLENKNEISNCMLWNQMYW